MGHSKYLTAPIGKSFGKWVVESYSHYDNEHHWKVRCSSCQKEFTRRAGQLTLGRSKGCQSCNSKERELYSFWEGIDGVSKQYLTKLRFRNKFVEVTLQDLVDQWALQKGICRYSGHKLTLAAKDSKWAESTASIDRIDSSKGYVKGNVQWVHKRINIMKSNMPEPVFLEWCEQVTNYVDKGGTCGV